MQLEDENRALRRRVLEDVDGLSMHMLLSEGSLFSKATLASCLAPVVQRNVRGFVQQLLEWSHLGWKVCSKHVTKQNFVKILRLSGFISEHLARFPYFS